MLEMIMKFKFAIHDNFLLMRSFWVGKMKILKNDLKSLPKQRGAVGFLAACVTVGLWVGRLCSGWSLALEPCKIRYLVTPTFATLRRNGRSRRFDCIFTIVNGPPRLRDLPSHPRLLEASQMPPRCLIDAVWVLALGSFQILQNTIGIALRDLGKEIAPQLSQWHFLAGIV